MKPDAINDERPLAPAMLVLRCLASHAMKPTTKRIALAGFVLALAGSFVPQAMAGRELVRFPEKFEEGVHYATVERGSTREELYTSRAVIEAAKKGQALPSGTVITLVDFRDGKLFRYVVMEKRAGWGTEYPPAKRNGEWEFQTFNADRSVNVNDDVSRCFSCHRAQEKSDFVFTLDHMRSAQ